jgi:inhibitor of KinA
MCSMKDGVIRPLGDQAAHIQWRKSISPSINDKIRSFTQYIQTHPIRGVNELVPAYCSLTVYYNPKETSWDELTDRLRYSLRASSEMEAGPKRNVLIPTLYGGEWGPDIDYVAEYHGRSVQEVIDLHSGVEYLVYMLGFSPGFPYLGGMDESIATPRLSSPRLRIPPGSVGIAGSQTGIYPSATPGGWQIIGRTPLKLYDPSANSPFLLKAGDFLKFVPITMKEYVEIEAQIKLDFYKPDIH